MDRMDASSAREHFADTIDRVRYAGERVVVRKHGKDVAAIVSMADLALIESLEDKADADAARAVLRNPRTVFVPYPKARKSKPRTAPPRRTRRA